MDLAHFRGFPLGKPFSLAGLLPVMPHQVVSLTALDRQHSASSQEERLSLFAFDVGEGITRDIQHLDILYIVLDGTALILADRTECTLQSGECILIPAQMPHAIEAKSELRILQLSVC